jgi:hypothetical protein
MFPILRKEINSFLNSLIAYIVIDRDRGVFGSNRPLYVVPARQQRA